MKKIIASVIIASLFCFKLSAQNYYKVDSLPKSDPKYSHKKDTVYTHKPDSAKYENDDKLYPDQQRKDNPLQKNNQNPKTKPGIRRDSLRKDTIR